MRSSEPSIDALVDSLRSSPEGAERLSEAARGRMVRAIRASIPERKSRAIDFADLFLPTRRWALLAAVPAVLLTVVLGPLAVRTDLGPVGTVGSEHETTLRLAKADGIALLLIADGQGPHRVYKSSDARRMTSGEVITVTDGAYRDRLEGGPSLVFYQVD
jgi:hypothetical protein